MLGHSGSGFASDHCLSSITTKPGDAEASFPATMKSIRLLVAGSRYSIMMPVSSGRRASSSASRIARSEFVHARNSERFVTLSGASKGLLQPASR